MLIPFPVAPPPPLPPLDDPWEGAGTELYAGRRACWSEDAAHFQEGPSLEELDVLGPLELRDRRIVALEEPLFVWEVEAAPDAPLELRARVRFTRWSSAHERKLAPAAIHYARSTDGTSLWLHTEEGVDELLVRCHGGEVEAAAAGDEIRLTARGTGRIRLAIVAAWNGADRDRTLEALGRKGVAGLVARHRRHLDLLTGLGVKVTTPDPAEHERVEYDKRDIESLLREHPAGHRALVDAPYDYGVILLMLGIREPVRDTLRGPLEDPDHCRLFAAYACWAGLDDFVRRHWARLMDAMHVAQAHRLARRALGKKRRRHSIRLELEDAAYDLRPVAEALGDREALAFLEKVIVRMDGVPRPVDWQKECPPLVRWAVGSHALAGGVTLAPELPEGWPEMTLERLRIGPTTLDVRVRRRPSGIAVKVKVTRGPAIVVHLAPRLPFTPVGVLVGGEPLAGPVVSLPVVDEVEATWHG